MKSFLKYIRLVVVATAVTLTLNSCLDKKPEDAILQDEAMQTFNDAEQYLTGIYAGLKTSALWSGYLTLLPDIQADLVYAVEGYSNTYGNIWQWQILSNNSEITSVYGSLYALISNCNFFLERIDAVIAKQTEEIAITKLEAYTGEVYFIRALCYSELAKCFCKAYEPKTAENELGVVLRSKYSTPEPLRRASLKDTYDFILEDLKKAEKLLSVMENNPSYPYASEAAAEALHARVALYMQDWDEAIKYATKVIEDDAFMLSSVRTNYVGGQYDDFTYMWGNDLAYEIIWEIGFTGTSFGGALGSVFLHYTSDYTYFYPDYVPAKWLLSAYDNADDRYSTYFAGSESGLQIGYASGLDWPMLVKYYGNLDLIKGYQLYHVCMPKVFRLAEQYLIRAEAYCEKELYSKASADLTTLRQTRYSTGGSANVTAANWRQFLSDERARELCMEGFRLHDLKRWHKGFTRTPQNGSLAEGSSLSIAADDVRFVWPIPQHELESPGAEIEPNESNL